MPWCPNCKNEYRDGITVCAECNIALIDSLEDVKEATEFEELVRLKNKDSSIRLIKYLRFSGISSATIKADETERVYIILVDEEEKKEALKHFNAFYTVEKDQPQKESKAAEDESIPDESSEFEEVYIRDDCECDSTEEFTAEVDSEFDKLIDFGVEESLEEFENEKVTKKSPEEQSQRKPSSLYATKEDAYKENRSTGIMFLSFACIGIIFIALNITGVISLISGTIRLTVMTVLFIAFFILGIYSLKRAQAVSGDLSAERDLTKKINNHLESFGPLDALDDSDWSDLNEELLYFKRTVRFKQKIIEQFGELDDNYLDKIIEDYYNSHEDQ